MILLGVFNFFSFIIRVIFSLDRICYAIIDFNNAPTEKKKMDSHLNGYKLHLIQEIVFVQDLHVHISMFFNILIRCSNAIRILLYLPLRKTDRLPKKKKQPKFQKVYAV